MYCEKGNPLNGLSVDLHARRLDINTILISKAAAIQKDLTKGTN